MNNFREMLDNIIMDAYDVQHYFDNDDEDQYSSALIKLTENSRKIVSEIGRLQSKIAYQEGYIIGAEETIKELKYSLNKLENLYRQI